MAADPGDKLDQTNMLLGSAVLGVPWIPARLRCALDAVSKHAGVRHGSPCRLGCVMLPFPATLGAFWRRRKLGCVVILCFQAMKYICKSVIHDWVSEKLLGSGGCRCGFVGVVCFLCMVLGWLGAAAAPAAASHVLQHVGVCSRLLEWCLLGGWLFVVMLVIGRSNYGSSSCNALVIVWKHVG